MCVYVRVHYFFLQAFLRRLLKVCSSGELTVYHIKQPLDSPIIPLFVFHLHYLHMYLHYVQYLAFLTCNRLPWPPILIMGCPSGASWWAVSGRLPWRRGFGRGRRRRPGTRGRSFSSWRRALNPSTRPRSGRPSGASWWTVSGRLPGRRGFGRRRQRRPGTRGRSVSTWRRVWNPSTRPRSGRPSGASWWTVSGRLPGRRGFGGGALWGPEDPGSPWSRLVGGGLAVLWSSSSMARLPCPSPGWLPW